MTSVTSTLRGLLAAVLLVLNTIGCATPIYALTLVKLCTRADSALRRRLDRALNSLAERWIRGNNAWMRLTQGTQWDVQGLDGLAPGGWYLVNANHQSWVDILVLQRVLGGRIPLLKFFLKQELIWVPVIGLAWWALDFPFMKRHSKAALRRNPALRNEDRETTRRACARFTAIPTSVMNFAEGTRFTPEKHRTQSSPYKHLLKPKAGALALAMHAMGEQFRSLIDVTIVYPDGVPSFWDFLCGRCPRIIVRLRQLPIPEHFALGNYEEDAAFRAEVHHWLAQMWQHKDAQIEGLLKDARAAAV